MALPVNNTTPDTTKIRSGQATVTATSNQAAQALGAISAGAFTAGLRCQEVSLQAGKANVTTVRVGNSADGCFWELAAGDTLGLQVMDINQVQLYNATGLTNLINWIARV